MPTVTVRAMCAADVDAVVAAAVDGADPADVLPPDGDPDPARWTAARAAALAEFLHGRLRGDGDAAGETSHLVLDDGRVLGVARLRPAGEGVIETGLWLVRAVRGHGVATAVLARLAGLARDTGATVLVADTTTGNAAALAALRRRGATLTRHDDGTVAARIPLTGRTRPAGA